MRKTAIIWIIYAAGLLAAFFMSSCASQKKYVASKAPVRTETRKGKEFKIVHAHIIGLIWCGIIFHFANEDSK